MKTWLPILTLFISNILLLFFAATGQIGFFATITIYWFQSCIIGLFHLIKMLSLKNVKFKKDPNQPSIPVKEFYALFFLFHYGIFHLVYAGFILFFPLILVFSTMMNDVNMTFSSEISLFTAPIILISIAAYFIHHFISYQTNFDPNKKVTFPNYMFYPYPRIIPMHAIIAGGFGLIMSGFSITNLLLIFIVLKTIADVLMHLFEHKSDYSRHWIKVVTIILVFFLIFGIIFAGLVSYSNNNPIEPAKNIHDEINACYKEDLPETCLVNLAIERNNDSLCEEMIPISWKYSNDANELVDICYNFLAQETENQDKCKLIQDLGYQQDCIEALIYKKAIKTQDASLCETITHPKIKESCIRTVN